MHKDARFTFEKYSNPDWPCNSRYERAHTYVPDEIFEPVLSTLQQYAPDILKHSGHIILESLKADQYRIWTWPETMSFVQSVWEGIDPAYGVHMAGFIEDADFRYRDVDPGRGNGECFSDHVEICRDKTINDPLCAVHEGGHLMALKRAPDQDDNEPADNIKEIQGMFGQECAYAHLVAEARDKAEAKAARLHRLSYYTGILSRVPLCTILLDQEKLRSLSLSQEFDRWSVDPHMAAHFMRQPDAPRYGAHHLHKHPFAAMVVPALYQRFQEKDPQEKRQMLSVLYEQGPKTTLVDVLSAFGVETVDDVRSLAESTCHDLVGEIKAYGFGGKPLERTLIIG